MNLKLEQVRRKQRIKRFLAADLIKKGATAHMAESYVMSLGNDDLTRMKEEQQLPEEDPRFCRDSSLRRPSYGLAKSRTVTHGKGLAARA